jgi:streptomycin 6-kinase
MVVFFKTSSDWDRQMQFPHHFIKNVLNIHGEAGKKWLHELPSLISTVEKKWQITCEAIFNNLSFNFVASVMQANGVPAVLKCAIPGKEFKHEINSLLHFNGIGAVNVIQSELDLGVMLLEKVQPGSLLESIADEETAIKISVELMAKLHKTPSDKTQFTPLHELINGYENLYTHFDGSTGPFSKRLVEHAKAISGELLMSMNKSVLLHGDLHYSNILFSDIRNWIAIDPKGLIGEPEYEIPFPRITKEMHKKTLIRSLDRFIAISGFDRQRVTGWFFTKLLLAAWWSFEDSGVIWQPFLNSAEIMSELTHF